MNIDKNNLQKHNYNCIVVLGMHRSGTSIFANILSELGVKMGETLHSADQFNIYGYVEDLEIKNLNQEIVPDWKAIPSQDVLYQNASKRKEKILAICKERNQLNLWGWEDSCTCITVEYWHYYLYNPFYVIVTRDKNNIANSLMHHEQIKARYTHLDRRYWLQLIEVYHKSIVNFLMKAQPNYMLVNYDYLIKNPASAYILVDKICEQVGLDRQYILKAIGKVKYND